MGFTASMKVTNDVTTRKRGVYSSAFSTYISKELLLAADGMLDELVKVRCKQHCSRSKVRKCINKTSQILSRT